MAKTAWQLVYAPAAIRDIDSLDKPIAKRLTSYLTDRVLAQGDPRGIGKALRGSRWGDCWRYRVGDYRVIVRILDREVVVMVLRAGNRKDVY